MFRPCVPFLFVSMLPVATAPAQQEPLTTVGAYGELHYNEPDGSRRGQVDFHRFVLYVGHAFTEKISFRSELEIEHTKIEAGSSNGGEVALEQAYLEFRLADAIGLRAGILLAPVGLTNLYHEPPVFHGVERPSIDRAVIPTTWREAGFGVFGAPMDGFRYQLYCTAGLKAAGFDGANGIRGGRQEGFESDPVNPSLTGRVDYSPVAGLEAGASFFAGNATGGEDSIGSVPVLVLSADARYALNLLSLRGVVAAISIGNAPE
ncbi:MAG: porin, partial [Bacteroidota bacterium]